jgi:glycosyltransferase involved in cell wall biosynthesis
VRKLNLEGSVEFLSWVENKKSFFDSIDIFLLTSRRETFGLVLLEAMKFCKPIISTDVDGPREIVSNDICALLVSAKQFELVPDLFTAAVLRLINEPELAQKMIENSLNKVKEKFSYEALKARMREIVG